MHDVKNITTAWRKSTITSLDFYGERKIQKAKYELTFPHWILDGAFGELSSLP